VKESENKANKAKGKAKGTVPNAFENEQKGLPPLLQLLQLKSRQIKRRLNRIVFDRLLHAKKHFWEFLPGCRKIQNSVAKRYPSYIKLCYIINN